MTAVALPTVAVPEPRRARRSPPAAACCGPRPRRCSALAGALDERFERCVELLAATRGRVVVTGMGKSGHVARKIAATFASTGTPALYVHPAEASHGDLGMITADDVVLALSNSGETPELADIVAYTRRFAIPLLAIVGRADSSLAETADLGAGAAAAAGGLPDGPGADHLDHRDAGARRRARGRAARAARLRHPGLQRAASGRQARPEAGAGRPADARGAELPLVRAARRG